MPSLRDIVERHQRTFNARDVDGWASDFAADAVMVVDGIAFRGRDAIRAYATGVLETLPGIRIELESVVAECGETFVAESRLISTDEHAAWTGWRLEGSVCELFRIVDGEIASCRTFFAYGEREAAAVTGTPPRADAARVAAELAGLRRVATLVARGDSRELLFATMSEEIAGLVGADPTAMLRFEPDDTVTLVGAWSALDIPFPIGARRPAGRALRAIRDRGTALRLSSAEILAVSPFLDDGRRIGIRSAVGVPIEVEGRIWGMTLASWVRPGPSPPDTEARIAGFTELVATVLANAQARAELTLLADEQAALRRVAELVARGVVPEQLFASVAEELCRLLGGTALMYRYEPDGSRTCVAAWSRDGRADALAEELPEDFGVESGRVGSRSVACGPITVEGGLWGILCVVFDLPEPPAPGIELRIARFAELVSTAIGNAQARSELGRLVDEQRALRRVATLVAGGASQPEVFGAVVLEASRLLGGHFTVLARYGPTGESAIVATHRAPDGITVGMGIGASGDGIVSRVLRTGRAARLDGYEGVAGRDAAIARIAGMQASVGAPIVVEGRVWGVLAILAPTAPLPPATEHRLAQFAELVAVAIGNAESREALTASRARIVATADETRWRLQRDVHDGAQQRLVHTVITLKLARAALAGSDGPARALVGEALDHAERATAELRELARGILPGALSRGGLRAGVESLVTRLDVPVDVDVPGERMPAALETTAYFVVAEALTNVVKHAAAGRASVRAAVEDGTLRLEVRDDGIGGADRSRGSGLVGLADRVAANGGTISIASPPGAGTTLAVELPLAEAQTPAGRSEP